MRRRGTSVRRASPSVLNALPRHRNTIFIKLFLCSSLLLAREKTLPPTSWQAGEAGRDRMAKGGLRGTGHQVSVWDSGREEVSGPAWCSRVSGGLMGEGGLSKNIRSRSAQSSRVTLTGAHAGASLGCRGNRGPWHPLAINCPILSSPSEMLLRHLPPCKVAHSSHPENHTSWFSFIATLPQMGPTFLAGSPSPSLTLAHKRHRTAALRWRTWLVLSGVPT